MTTSVVIETKELVEADLDELIREVERYLAAVELFRQLGQPPHWGSQ